jgi:hypothetical protein
MVYLGGNGWQTNIICYGKEYGPEERGGGVSRKQATRGQGRRRLNFAATNAHGNVTAQGKI